MRPAWCRGDNYIHKKVVLNSLVAEKLFALEVAADTALQHQEEFNAYLEGRREQVMRQMYFYQEAFAKVALDSEAVKKAYAVAGRDYDISWISCQNATQAEKISHAIKNENKDLSAAAKQFGLAGTPGQCTVRINPLEDDTIIEALYSDKLQQGQIVGPVKVAKNNYIFMQIDGWVDHKVIAEKDVSQRLFDTRERLQSKKAQDIYEAHVYELMKNKKMQFNPAVFKKVVNLISPVYLRSQDEIKKAFNDKLWQGDSREFNFDSLGTEMDKLQDQTLFTVDGAIWSVARFEKYLRRHPLVFRKRKISSTDFPNEFRLAIADMVRDYFITKAAYAKGYDKQPQVERNFNMWKDNLHSLYFLDRWLRSNGKLAAYKKNPLQVIESDLDSVVVRLQKKYEAGIEINTDEFESIKLSRIDLMAYQKNVPFPIIVPNFPQITTYNRLDYGRKMELP